MCTAPTRDAPIPDWLPALLHGGLSESCVSSRSGGDAPQSWKDASGGNSGCVRAPKSEVEFAVQSVKLLVCLSSPRIGFDNAILRAKRVLRFLQRAKRAGGQCCENRGAEAGDVRFGNEHGFIQHIGVNAIQHFIFLRDAAGIDDPADWDAMLFHAFQDNAGVEGRALNRCE